MEKVIKQMREISEKLFKLVNSVINRNDGLLFYGHYIPKDSEEYQKVVYNLLCDDNCGKGYNVDYRDEDVDIIVKEDAYSQLCSEILSFWKQNPTEDEFILVLGCSINLYYVVGLETTFGQFDVTRITEHLGNQKLIDYCIKMNEFICLRFMSIANSDSYVESTKYLKEMITECPEYRFGLMYSFFEEGNPFKKNTSVDLIKYYQLLGKELFLHMIGTELFDHEEGTVVDGKIEASNTSMFSRFGYGIPCYKIKVVNGGQPSIETYESNLKQMRELVKEVLYIEKRHLVFGSPISTVSSVLSMLCDKYNEQSIQLRETNAEVTKLNKQKNDMMEHLAHSWGNECYPDIVRKVAEELLKSGETTRGNKLLRAYNSEKGLLGQILYVQAAMNEQKDYLKNKFFTSLYVPMLDTDDRMKIHYVIEEAIENIFFGLLTYDGNNQKKKICQKKLISKSKTISELLELYSERLEHSEHNKVGSFLEWFSNYIFPISIQYIDNTSSEYTWRYVNFGYTDFGKIVIKNIMTELFVNVLFHGEKYCSIELISENDVFKLSIKNGISENNIGEQKGLVSINEILAKLNFGTCLESRQAVLTERTNGDEYLTTLLFAKSLFIDQEDQLI